jgi:NifU-like protein involved in Fe-S cluster formation/bacterioferritin-associated ferredoxin
MDAFTWLYSDIVKDHFQNPRNVYDPDENFQSDADGIVGNVKCGDQMQFFIKVDKGDVITDVRWKTYGCASAIASTSMLSEVVKGLSIREAYTIKPEDISKRLGGLPDNKIHCSVLGDKAMRAAIDAYLEKTGRPGAFKDVGATVICKCLNITDRDIEKAVKDGARDWEQLQERTKIGTVCGNCKDKATDLLAEYVHVFGFDE